MSPLFDPGFDELAIKIFQRCHHLPGFVDFRKSGGLPYDVGHMEYIVHLDQEIVLADGYPVSIYLVPQNGLYLLDVDGADPEQDALPPDLFPDRANALVHQGSAVLDDGNAVANRVYEIHVIRGQYDRLVPVRLQAINETYAEPGIQIRQGAVH